MSGRDSGALAPRERWVSAEPKSQAATAVRLHRESGTHAERVSVRAPAAAIAAQERRWRRVRTLSFARSRGAIAAQERRWRRVRTLSFAQSRRAIVAQERR